MKVSRPPLRSGAAPGTRRNLAVATALGTAAALVFSGLITTPALAAPSGESIGTGTNWASGTPTLAVSPGFDLSPEAGGVLDLVGSGFATENAWGQNFGGAYILFGVVSPKDESDPGSWAPSKRGVSGTNYDYAPGAGTNQTMVNYPGNETQEGVPFMDDNGDWAGQMVIPGAQFESQAGNQIDCLVQQCGVITIGAHGQAQGGVEVFTPVTFAQAAVITSQPADQTVTAGSDAVFAVEASGSPDLSYQWQTRSSEAAAFADVAGATEASLTLPAVSSAAHGTQVRVVVTNDAGSVTSNTATLTVNTPATATTTTLAAQTTAAYPTDFVGEDIALSATVAPAEAAGSVEFLANGVSLGTAEVAAGAAELTTRALAAGAQEITSVFTPADPSVFEISTSAARTYRIVDLAPAVSAIEQGQPTRVITDAQFRWSVANWVSFNSGPGKEILSGDQVSLADLPANATVNDRANQEFVFAGGTGSEDAAGNRVVSFDGKIRLTSGTMPRWDFANPQVHTNAAGDGYVTAEVETAYFGSEMGGTDDSFAPGRIVVSTFRGGSNAVDGATHLFAATPLFEGQVAPGTWGGEFTGATFTNEFLRYVNIGVRSFMLQTGTTGSNLTKPALPISLSFASNEVVAPTLSVSPTGELPRKGGDVTISGTGIDASPQTVWGTPAPAGVYVSLGWIQNSGWKPSENAASESRVAVATRWVQETEETQGDYVKWTREPGNRASFSFTLPDVSYDAVMEKKPEGDYRLAAYSIGAGGVRQAMNELSLDLAFAPEETKPPVVPPVKKLPFVDMKKGDKFYKEIAWMYESKLSTGTKQPNGSVKYLPKQQLSREAMAAFLYRMEGSTYVGPKVSPFADVKPGDKFYNEITWMYAEKIAKGTKQATGKPKFMPKSSMSREAMAAFMYRMEGSKAAGPKTSPFADMKPGDKFYKEIVWMFDSGLSTGNKRPSGKPAYLPKDSVTREAMAAFLYRLSADTGR